MEQIFLTLLNISITASWIVLAVVLLRFILKKAPKWTVCLLWAIVGLRLIMPFSLESVFSLLPDKAVIDPGTYQVQTGFEYVDDAINDYFGAFSDPVSDSVGTDKPAVDLPAQEKVIDPIAAVSRIWIAGVIVMAVYSILSWLLLRRRVAEAVPYRDRIYFCDRVDSAFILGVIRPRIYLSFNLSEKQREYIIGHEQAHLTRRDHLWKPLGFVLLSIYWFNPVMWLAYILLCRDIELACDEKAIRHMDAQAKQGYSDTLLACSIPRRMIVACPVAFGEVGIKDRIKSVANYKKPAFWVIVIALICCIAAAVCFLTDPTEPIYSYSEAEQAFQALQEQQADDSTSERALCREYARLFRMISNGAEAERDQFALLTREITANTIEFENEEVFTVAKNLHEAYAAIAAGEDWGVQDLRFSRATSGDFTIQIDYLGDMSYSVKTIQLGEPWFLDPNNGSKPYNAELGNYLVEIRFYDFNISSKFRKQYPSGAQHLNAAVPGTQDILFKHVADASHGHRFYIGSNMPFHVDEQARTEAAMPMGSVSVTLNLHGIHTVYNNVHSYVLLNPYDSDIDAPLFNVSYCVLDRNDPDFRFITRTEACALYGVDTADFRRAAQAYLNSDAASPSEKVYAEETLSNRNIPYCWPFCAEDGTIMILAPIYTEIDGKLYIMQKMLPLNP